MEDNKFNYRNIIKWETQKAKEEIAVKNWKRNLIGLFVSAILFVLVILSTLNGWHLFGRFSTLCIVIFMVGVFFFSRELCILPKGQIIASGVKATLCLGMAMCYVIVHKGYWDWIDYGILGILIGVVLLDVPKVMRAAKTLKD